jgi:hypothetical protein
VEQNLGVQMSAPKYSVAYYDKYYDIPLRGVINEQGSFLPFVAQIDQDAPEETWVIGIPAWIEVFPLRERLAALYQAITDAFRAWNSKFRRGEVPENSHPQKTDGNYQSIMETTDEIFRSLKGQSVQYYGFFSVENEVWCFQTKPLK